MALNKETVGVLGTVVNAMPKKSQELMRDIFSQDALEVIKNDKMYDVKTTKNLKEIFFNFFGMNKNWKLGRNIGGMFMVHCPEYPTYFIPSFSQSKDTGEASHVKKGEIPRGLITGGLEGIAVGALVSGEKLRGKEMIPYVFLGAGLQLISCTLFPWLGEKCGKYLYNKKMIKQGLNPNSKPEIQPETKTNVGGKDSAKTSFSGQNAYPKIYSGSLRI